MADRGRRQLTRVRLLFLFADVGGGHRAPAEAVRDALRRTVGEAAHVEMVDMLADYAPWPYNRGQQTYTRFVQLGRSFQRFVYHGLDGRRRIQLGASIMWRPMRRATRELMRDHPADLVVSFHPTYSYPLTWLKIPSVFVFTDLITNHALWCALGAQRYIVPTPFARDGAIQHGVPANRIDVTGLPVHPRFLEPIASPGELRKRLGVKSENPIILLSGGGEGLGRMYDVAYAIGQSNLNAQLVIIAGRNQVLREQLQEVDWHMATTILGFTRDMPDWLALADVLITKSGSNTIAEALVRGRPMIVFDYVPGQEEGNPEYITAAGAGAFCPRPPQVVNTLRSWLSRPDQLAQMSANAHQIARPNAAFDVAQIVYDIARNLQGQTGVSVG